MRRKSGAHRLFFIGMFVLCLLGHVTIPAAAQLDLLEFWNLPVNIGQPKPGHLMDTTDWIDGAQDCEKECNEMASLVREGNLNNADRLYYEKELDQACNCAKKNYLMAIRACPDDDLAWQANLIDKVGYFEVQMGNTENAAKYANFSRQLRQAAAQKDPLPPWIAVLGLFFAILLLGRKARGDGL
jgi:hypothetical protein